VPNTDSEENNNDPIVTILRRANNLNSLARNYTVRASANGAPASNTRLARIYTDRAAIARTAANEARRNPQSVYDAVQNEMLKERHNTSYPVVLERLIDERDRLRAAANDLRNEAREAYANGENVANYNSIVARADHRLNKHMKKIERHHRKHQENLNRMAAEAAASEEAQMKTRLSKFLIMSTLLGKPKP
jgi:hypothetical protein